jgi:RNA polymerase sigma-70 factor (ECF subfamily)
MSECETSSTIEPLPFIPRTAINKREPGSVTGRVRRNLGLRIPELPRVADRTRLVPAGEEWQFVQRALAGDRDALSMLFARHNVRLYRAAFSVLRSKEDAEDALQDGLLSAYLKLESFEGRSRFSTWLTRIVLNAAFMKRRRLRAHLQIPIDDVAGDDTKPPVVQVIDARPNAEQAFAQLETRRAVHKAMTRLSPLLRSTLRLRDIQGFSTREAAKAEHVNISLMKSRALRARRRMAILLDAQDVNL